MNRKVVLYISLATILIASVIPLKALADDKSFYSSNDILFYDSSACVPASTNTSSTSTTSTTSTTPSSSGSTSTSGAASTSSIPYKLPATSGKTGFEERIDANGAIPSGGKVTFHNLASKGKAWQDYYITMRWTWTKWNWNGTNTGTDSQQLAWMRQAPRIVLVTNTRNNKSIYADALESGPAPWTGAKGGKGGAAANNWSNPQDGTPVGYTGRVSGFPPAAINALEAKQGMSNGSGDTLTYEWAPDQSVTPGPTNATASGGAGGTSSADCTGTATSASSAGEHGWDLSGTHAMTYFDQSSSEWKNKPFGSGTLGACGCGPTSLAMIVNTLTGDKSVNPESMAAFYASHGGQASGCGSSWNWSVIEKNYPVKVTDLGKDLAKAKGVLDRGGLVLFSWTGAPFTGGNHIMVMRKYSTDGKIYIASSGGSTNRQQSDQAWDESIFNTGYLGPAVGGRGSTGFLKGLWGIEKK